MKWLLLFALSAVFVGGCWDLPPAEVEPCKEDLHHCHNNVAWTCSLYPNQSDVWVSEVCANGEVCVIDTDTETVGGESGESGPICIVEDTDTNI